MNRWPTVPDSVRLFLFGSPRAERAGQRLAIHRRKGTALLAYLAITARPHAREALATLLWPELPTRSALANLRRDLTRLRADVGELFVADRHEIALDPTAPLWVDVRAFLDAVERARVHLHPTDGVCDECIVALTGAVTLYEADFLAGFTLPDSAEWEEWQRFQSEALRQRFADVLERLVILQVRNGAIAATIPLAHRWVALDSLHEEAHRVLMSLLAWHGQTAAALQQFEALRGLLHEELGVPPEAESEALAAAIRERRLPPPPRATAPSPPVAATLPRRPFAPVDQQVRFTHSADGTRIGYAVVGEGPPLVKVANPLTHLQYDWESPVWRHWIEELSRDHTLIRYDERGCGLSARDVTRFSIDAWVEDLEAVVDDLGLERFPIFGTSQGASVAIAYAARHPERLSALVCLGGYARGRFHRGKAPERTEAEMLLSLIRFGWGQDTPVFRRVFASLFVPGGTPEQVDWFTELARVTTDAEPAALMEQAFYALDVSDLAPRVTTPTLVMHPRGDAMIPFEEGNLIAALIPGARFVPLDSQNHILLAHEPAWAHFLDELRGFLGSVERRA